MIDKFGFQSTPSSRRVTGPYRILGLHGSNFNPHPPRGEWRQSYLLYSTRKRFQSTPSSRRVTSISQQTWKPKEFQSTPSSRRVTICPISSLSTAKISIHTLLAESDLGYLGTYNVINFISIHTLLAESDSKISQNTNIVLEHLAQILHIYNSLFFILT